MLQLKAAVGKPITDPAVSSCADRVNWTTAPLAVPLSATPFPSLSSSDFPAATQTVSVPLSAQLVAHLVPPKMARVSPLPVPSPTAFTALVVAPVARPLSKVQPLDERKSDLALSSKY